MLSAQTTSLSSLGKLGSRSSQGSAYVHLGLQFSDVCEIAKGVNDATSATMCHQG